jgi:hypothetical protein
VTDEGRWAAAALLIVVASVAAAWTGWSDVATLILAAGGIAAVYAAKSICTGYNSFTAIFIVFFLLYGLSVPFDDMLGLVSVSVSYPSPHRNAWFLSHLGLALAGLLIGLGLIWGALPRTSHAISSGGEDQLNSRALFITAMTLAALASIFEIVNFLRVGGAATVMLGKTIYQSRVEELGFTAPSFIVANVAFAALSLHVACTRSRTSGIPWRNIAIFAAVLLPIFASAVLLTRRTEIVAWILIVFVGATWSRPLRRITAGLAGLTLAAYLLAPALGATRSAFYTFELNTKTVSSWWDAFTYGLNPGAGEFGTPFGVFNEYESRVGEEPLRWGRTYLDGIAAAVPSRLWPGEKPKQIDYQLRDRLFPAYGAQGSIESPGFSAILEATINFGTWGVVAVYAVFGVVLGLLEMLRARWHPVIAPMFYLSLLPLAQTLHRSAFGPSVLSVGAMTMLALILFFMIYAPAARRTQ